LAIAIEIVCGALLWKGDAGRCPCHGCGSSCAIQGAVMDPVMFRTVLLAAGLVAVVGVAIVVVVLMRRRLGVADEPAAAVVPGSYDWVDLLAAINAGAVPTASWIKLAPELAARAGRCPPALRPALIAALGRAAGACGDVLAAAAMTHLRTALAAP
jgi:hypothetical protein